MRTVELHPDFEKAFDKNSRTAYEKLAPSKKKAIMLSITDAKSEETKQKRIAKAIELLLK
ncbi:MAG: YdeI/OmpD-associated family protein [Ignavibacteriales bacterium]|nr:YdeI/OmpD-associated family protein [Ignavibacteriales bacterium]